MNNFIWGFEVGAGGLCAVLIGLYLSDRFGALCSKIYWTYYWPWKCDRKHKREQAKLACPECGCLPSGWMPGQAVCDPRTPCECTNEWHKGAA